MGAFQEGDNTDEDFTPLYRLKRIPPLSELDEARTDERIGEPA